jgi:hypothetical protein
MGVRILAAGELIGQRIGPGGAGRIAVSGCHEEESEA